jgi:ATP diphosphatase
MGAVGRRPGRTRSATSVSGFDRLVAIMARLRSPAGCAWDRKQTHRSLRAHLVEEAYETIDAIDRHDARALAEELGDVLLQVVFHAQIARERRAFTIDDVVGAIADKLIRRHPHVFTADGRPLSARARRARGISTPGRVKEQWERIKAKEKSGRAVRNGVLAGVPRAVPALVGAYKIGGRVAAVGFDWPRAADVLDKIDEEVREFREALAENETRAAEEMGDLLFSIANLARKLGIDPESALRAANRKFTDRFSAIEARLAREGRTVHDASPDDLEAAWAAVKTAPAARRPSRPARPSTSRGPNARRSRE